MAVSTTCQIYNATNKDEILQGDIFRNISYIYKTKESDDYVDITEFQFPYIIVLSQSCDISAMSKMIENGGKIVKFMPSVLVAPIYEKESLKTGEVLKEIVENMDFTIQKDNFYTSKEMSVIDKDYHARFHLLKFDNNPLPFDDAIIDFKHYFTISAEYLHAVRDHRVCHLEQLFCEQITLRFSNYLSRVAIPDKP